MSEQGKDRSEAPQHGGASLGMGGRGVTRPMAEMQLRQHMQQAQKGEHDKQAQGEHAQQQEHEHEHHDGDDGHMQHGPPYSDARHHMLRMHHQQTLWVYWSLIILGFWTLLAPFSFGYLSESLWVQPSGGRGVWFSSQTHDLLRAWLMTISDLVSGLLLVIFGWRSLTPNRPISLWTCCGVGAWMSAAPLLFWAPTAAAYLNDTLVGALVIALTILIPGMPNMIMYMKMGPPTPPGWSYNPSSWPQRWIMIVTGFAGWLVSRYLAMFQLGYIDHVWDPFFAEASQRVLNSNMSHAWPISDGGLGAFSYTFEFLMGWMGSPSRWRTMPWMVTFFGVLVIPLGLTHIILVISQPVVVGAWCTFCLLAALIMLPMIPLEVDEVIAMGQHLVQSKRKGDSLWRAFWKGGTATQGEPDERTPPLMEMPAKPWQVFKSSIWGMSFPWTLSLASLIGIWLMFTPAIFGAGKPAADIEHLGGALIVTVSIISMGEVVRAGRYLNVLLGLMLAIVPWLLDGGTTAACINDLIAGLVVIGLSLPRGVKRETYGSWDRYVV